MADPSSKGTGAAGSPFVTTQWSMILAAGDTSHPSAREALEALCRQYWQPVYVYLRRRGADGERARDLTQGFFTTLLEKNYVGDARRERGRFRTFLLASVQNYARNDWHREQALKRGGGAPHLPLDAAGAEQAYALEPFHTETPERLFDRRWARSLLDRSLELLRQEGAGMQGQERFRVLAPFLGGEADTSYSEAAHHLQMTESAVRVAVHRMRRRFRAILRTEVERTVQDPAQVDDELGHLFQVLGS